MLSILEMTKVLNLKESRKLDELSTNKENTLDALIDNAGKALSTHIIENISNPFKSIFLCVCGIGNNGMDAIVCNYYLNKNNVESKLLIINSNKIDSKYLKKYVSDDQCIDLDDIDDISYYDYIIDGIFGTGLNRDIKGVYLNSINKIKGHKNIISIDVPSGIYTDSGKLANVYIDAKDTITFTYPKLCHFIGDGYSATGNLYVYPIGHSVDDLKGVNIQVVSIKDIAKKLKPRHKDLNKYSESKVISFCGSKKYTGALLLSNLAAMRAGVKILKKIIPSSLAEISYQQLESIDLLIEDNNNGYLGMESYDDIINELSWSDNLLIGPGLDDSKDSASLISEILRTYSGKCILDAGAFTPIINRELKVQDLPDKSILTPHKGEFLKILGISAIEFENDMINILDHFSKKLCNRIIVLKGPNTIIMNGEGNKYIISNGNSLMSTAGTGDVLSGIITAYVSSGYSLLDSSIIGSYVHAQTSVYLYKQGYDNIIASDLLPLIPRVQFDLRTSGNES